MEQFFDQRVRFFLKYTFDRNVRMLLVGGGAVNFHGYQRSSADVDFWIDMEPQNLDRLILALQDCGYDVDSFPQSVVNAEQNISIKISPIADIELITRFGLNKSFDQAYKESEQARIDGYELLRYQVLSYQDLIDSKLAAARPKDLLDIQELERRKSK